MIRGSVTLSLSVCAPGTKRLMSNENSSVPAREYTYTLLLVVSTTSVGPTAMSGSGGATRWSLLKLLIADDWSVP